MELDVNSHHPGPPLLHPDRLQVLRWLMDTLPGGAGDPQKDADALLKDETKAPLGGKTEQLRTQGFLTDRIRVKNRGCTVEFVDSARGHFADADKSRPVAALTLDKEDCPRWQELTCKDAPRGLTGLAGFLDTHVRAQLLQSGEDWRLPPNEFGSAGKVAAAGADAATGGAAAATSGAPAADAAGDATAAATGGATASVTKS